MHASPPVPHSDAHWEAVWRQLPLLQQPLGQLVGVQAQAPFWHAWPLGQGAPVLPQTHAPLVQRSAVLPQATHAPPLEPHAVRVVPATQVPLEQQPPLQRLVGLQAEVQVPLLHASSAGQSVSVLQPQTPLAKHTWPAVLVVQLTHGAPPLPQVVALAVWQAPLLSQQPVGQLVAVHLHVPLTHCCPLAQAAPVLPQTHVPLLQVSALLPQARQARPFVPQAVGSLVPATQVLLLVQQPPLHGSLGPHAELQTWLLQASSVGHSVAVLQPQTPLKQTCPRPLWLQSAQVAPPVPQALVAVPATQVLPLQQPLAQLVAVQTQVPFTHAWPAAQAPQVAPLVPQLVAVCAAYATQAPLLVQQPLGQFVALQVRHLP
jgi:hypothetical protein